MKDNITLIGAGLAGSLCAVYLAKRGFHVSVYERRPDMRKEKVDGGRSINLALSTRGIHALKQVGLYNDIMKIAIPMRGRMIHNLDGSTVFQQYGKDETEVIYSVSRAELNMSLMSLAEQHENVAIHFNERCTGMDFASKEIKLFNESDRKEYSVKASPVIGTDGSASALRTDMQNTGHCSFSQDYLEHGYKELSIPAGANNSFLLENNALHIWPRGSYMMIALPNIDGSFTCTLFLQNNGNPSFASLTTNNAVEKFFSEQFPDAVAFMPTLTKDFFSNPTGSLVTIHCDPWYVKSTAVLLGDAAHAIVPFFGQGMNCAFEDCVYLDECIKKYGADWEKIFPEYYALRKPNADAIAELAVENFIEMRDRVADPGFLFQKKIEHLLEEKFPDRFIPKYSMVTFHRIPYALALQRGKIQDKILQSISLSRTTLDEVDFEAAERVIMKELEPIIG